MKNVVVDNLQSCRCTVYIVLLRSMLSALLQEWSDAIIFSTLGSRKGEKPSRLRISRTKQQQKIDWRPPPLFWYGIDLSSNFKLNIWNNCFQAVTVTPSELSHSVITVVHISISYRQSYRIRALSLSKTATVTQLLSCIQFKQLSFFTFQALQNKLVDFKIGELLMPLLEQDVSLEVSSSYPRKFYYPICLYFFLVYCCIF